jgi:hypothetical protein
MDIPRTTHIAAVFIAAAALAGCGDDEEAPRATAAGATTPAATVALNELPEELAGTWETTTRPSDIHDSDEPPAKLTDRKPDKWQLEFHSTGGSRNGPSVTLDNDDFGTFGEPLTIEGDQLVVHYGPPCEVFDWTVQGDKLILEPTGSGCPSTSMSSIYSVGGWTRVD